MSPPSPGHSITARLSAPPAASATADLTAAVSAAGGVLTALDVVESHGGSLVADVTCNAFHLGGSR